MRCPSLSELPPAPLGRRGWPWTEGTPRLSETLADGSPWPRISIVMPSYNRRALIEESLRSVLLQGYPDLELLVIDGGSSDGTAELLERYAPWLAACVIEPDHGWRDAVGKGFARSTGQIVTFFSCDDLYLPGTFGIVGRRWIELDGYGAIIGGFFHADANSGFLEDKFIPARLPHPGPIDLSLTEPRQWRLHQVGTFYTGEALDAVGRSLEQDLLYNADRELLYRICRRFPVDLVTQPLAAFRIHDDSLTGGSERRSAAQEEYARMQLSFCTGDPADDRRRRQIARHYLAKAQMSDAKYQGLSSASVLALLKAVRYEPSRLWTRAYLKIWLQLFGLLRRIPRAGAID